MYMRRLFCLLSLCIFPYAACSTAPLDDDDVPNDDDDSAGDDDDSAGDDDDSAGDDDDSSGDDDDSSGDDDDSSESSSWSQCASAGSTPDQDGWTLSVTGPAGAFGDGDSTLNGGGSAGITDPSWGLWSQAGGLAVAALSLDGGALGEGDVVSLEFDNGWLVSGGEAGVALHAQGNEVMRLSFSGGDSGYRVTDHGGTSDPLLAFSAEGMSLAVTQLAGGAYELSADGTTVHSGVLASGELGGDELRVFSSSSGPDPEDYDVYFNCLEVSRD